MFQGRKWIVGSRLFPDQKNQRFWSSVCTAVVDTSSHARRSVFKVSLIEIIGKGLSSLIASVIIWTTFVRYFAFKDLKAPWSMVCREDVLWDRKRYGKILIQSLGELGSYLQLMQPYVALSQVSHLILQHIPQKLPSSSSFFCSRYRQGSFFIYL